MKQKKISQELLIDFFIFLHPEAHHLTFFCMKLRKRSLSRRQGYLGRNLPRDTNLYTHPAERKVSKGRHISYS